MRKIKVVIKGPEMEMEANGFSGKECKTTIDSIIKKMQVKKVNEKSKITVNELKVPVGVVIH